MPKILVIDDQPAVCVALATLFELHGLEVRVAATPDEAIAAVLDDELGAVVQDMNFRQSATSGEEGMDLLRRIKAIDPDLPVVAMTAFTSIEGAVGLIKAGASDYVPKPWDDRKLVATVSNLARLRSLEQENARLLAQRGRARHKLAERYDLAGLVYASDAMHEIVSLAVKVAPADVPVLITGPNGTGKERLASIVQANSRRRDRPFVKVNAGALPDELVEAELFGAEAGAFTGAARLRIGRFEEADGGTLFLDEIGTLSLNGQAKLLRVLQTGEYQRLGSSITRKADVRVLSATNRDLPRAIAEGSFREDLYFRINVIELPLPALRDRPEDIVPIASHLLERQAAAAGERVTLSERARHALVEHDWPGNVRELENRLTRAVLVRKGEAIEPQDLGLDAAARVPPAPSAPPGAASGAAFAAPSSERAEIERALVEARGVVAKAAASLGLSRQGLYRRMDRLGIQLERKLK
ncbi:Fis family transcriptional regulator [Sorangium cellulosum]|uniref:Fis family transcriptional regulator n=1 Tax=Sorangium cellulosum TaxID=56 RepID=A0A2L0ETK3_SORCE|nr:sigma-54 dependent transcriptional regulator [Sorangium cellulosum]AUX42609.1 Fis family transcriptional regulator [Sorangium cellulosum]